VKDPSLATLQEHPEHAPVSAKPTHPPSNILHKEVKNVPVLLDFICKGKKMFSHKAFVGADAKRCSAGHVMEKLASSGNAASDSVNDDENRVQAVRKRVGAYVYILGTRHPRLRQVSAAKGRQRGSAQKC